MFISIFSGREKGDGIHMRHQYMTDVFWKRMLQRGTDAIVDLYAKYFVADISRVQTLPSSVLRTSAGKHATSPQQSQLNQILFITLGHMGDALIASYAFPLIRRRYPDAAIDVLAGEWCAPVLENNPYIRDHIIFDHIRVNRSDAAIIKKFLRHRTTARSALKTIRSRKHDCSIEGRVHYPNGTLLSYRGDISRRIGFGSGAYGALLTDEVAFPSGTNFHLLEALAEELKRIGIEASLDSFQPYFTTAIHSEKRPHPFAGYFAKPYIILHPESGNPGRTVRNEFWLRVVSDILRLTDDTVIVCGTTPSSSELSSVLSSTLDGGKERIINASGKLTLDEFFILSSHARAALTLESFAAHLCAINCETISFFRKGSGALFFPFPNRKSTVIHDHSESEGVQLHPKIVNHFVSEIDSEETWKFVVTTIRSLAHR